MIAVAAEQRGPGIGCIRLRRIPDATADSLQAFVQEAVATGSLLHTGGLSIGSAIGHCRPLSVSLMATAS
jgi:hypothetical protein